MSRKAHNPQKEASKNLGIPLALELGVDLELRRLLDSCGLLGDFITSFAKRVKLELQRVRDGDQTNVPLLPFFVHSEIPYRELKMLFTGVLPLYSFLRVIQLHHCAIGDNGILVIVEFIRGYRPPADKNPFGIQCVEFPGCQIGPVGAKHISTLLTENESIGRCILDFNPLGDAGVKVIASAVRWNGTLEELSLQHCGIESPGAEAIAEGVLSCSNVRSLSLRGNALGPEGIKHVGAALSVSSRIEVLDVADTRFGHSYEAVEALCHGVDAGGALTSIDMDFNTLTPDAVPLVAALPVKNKRIVELRVNERMDANYYSIIQNALEQNGKGRKKKKYARA